MTTTTTSSKTTPVTKGQAVNKKATKTKAKMKTTAADRANKAAQRAQKAQKAAAIPFGERIRIRWGLGGAKALYGFIRGVLVAATGFFAWIAALFAATNVAPNFMLIFYKTSGLTENVSFDQVLVLWLAPSLVLILLLVALVIAVVVWVWKVQCRLGNKARRALLGEDN